MFADAATEDFFRARLDHMIDLRQNDVDRTILNLSTVDIQVGKLADGH